jgi:hypothetical protein
MKPVHLLVLIVGAMMILGPSALAAGATAKVAFGKATAVAQRWQGDAVPVSISTLAVRPDGTAASWSYIFYSPKRQQGYSVATQNGEIVDTGEVTGHLKAPIDREFVDSDQAITEAGKHGLSGKNETTMSLLVMGQSTDSPGLYWTVSRGFDKGDVSVVIDARSGEFSYENQMP